MVDIINTINPLNSLSFIKQVPATVADSLVRLYEAGSGEVAVAIAQAAKFIKEFNASWGDRPKDDEYYRTLEIYQNGINNSLSGYSVSHTGTIQEPIYLTYIGGVLTLLSGDAAQDWLDAISLDIDAYIKPPELLLVNADYVPYDSFKHVNAFTDLKFAATFETEVGESSLSNIITLLAGGNMWYSVTVDISKDKVPDLAIGVRYYRMFNGVFRLVAEEAL